MTHRPLISPFFFFNDTATTEIYTLSLHDALPICIGRLNTASGQPIFAFSGRRDRLVSMDTKGGKDRKSRRLNSSHSQISYAVFCLKKKTNITCPSETSSPYSSMTVECSVSGLSRI